MTEGLHQIRPARPHSAARPRTPLAPPLVPARDRRSRLPLGRLLSAAALIILSACGGDGPTSPVDPPIDPPVDPTPAALVAGVDTVRPSELVTLRPVGITGRSVPDSIIGRLGSAEFRAIRIDDSTLVGLVPQVAAGSHVARFVIGTKAHLDTLTVLAPVVIADPTATAEAIFTLALAKYDAIEANLDAFAASGADTVALRQFITSGRAALQGARADFLALSTAERAAAVPFIVSQATALGLDPNAQPSLRMADAIDLCTLITPFPECGRISATQNAILAGAREVVKCSAKTLGSAGVGGVLGGAAGAALGAFLGGAGSVPGLIAGIKNGAAIGAGVGLAWCSSDVWDKLVGIYDAAITPVVVSAMADIDPDFGDLRTGASLRMAALNAPDSTAFTVGQPRQVNVFVEFRSLSLADASGPPVVAALVTSFNTMAAQWNALRTKFPLFSLPEMKLPAGPRTTVRKQVPASYLNVGPVSLAGATSVEGGSGLAWTVQFNNAAQGDDHNITYAVDFEYPGFPSQRRSLTNVLKPVRYGVATLGLTSALDTVFVNGQTTLIWTASDSSGDVLTEEELEGRKPTWTTLTADLASVASASGVVTGVAPGAASIRGVLEEGKVDAPVDVWYNFVGSYTLLTLDGVELPGITYEDSTYIINTSGGGLGIAADGTFGFSHGAVGTNIPGGETFDEGGSGHGTYTVGNFGRALLFTTIEQQGTPVSIGTGFIENGVMMGSASTPEGSAALTLRKN